jgi:hypothetical protein
MLEVGKKYNVTDIKQEHNVNNKLEKYEYNAIGRNTTQFKVKFENEKEIVYDTDITIEPKFTLYEEPENTLYEKNMIFDCDVTENNENKKMKLQCTVSKESGGGCKTQIEPKKITQKENKKTSPKICSKKSSSSLNIKNYLIIFFIK